MKRQETMLAGLAVGVLLAAWTPLFAQSVTIDTGNGQAVTAQNGEVKINGRKNKKEKAPPAPKVPEVPTFTVKGGFESTKDKARDSAIRAAQELVVDHLAQQEPPVLKTPTIELVRRMALAEQEEIKEEQIGESGKTETMYQATVAFKVRPEHVRELRSRERAAEALWVFAGLGALAGVFALFFRIDAWTKGYLTQWLVLGTIGAASLVTGLWWMAK